MKYISVYADKLKRGRMDLIYPLSSDSPTPTGADGEFYFTIAEDALTQTIYLTQSAANAITVDWGDGSTPDSPSDTSAELSHTYDAAGDYVVSVTCAEGEIWSPGDGTNAFAVNTLTAAVLRRGVTAMPLKAFMNCAGLTSITLPSSLTSIGINCFLGCTSLASITIPSSVTSIGINCFNGCTSLASITIPSSVTSIGTQMFRGCTSLASVTLPSSVTSIGSYAFYDTTSLASLTCKAAEPPTIASPGALFVPADCAIYVPAASVSAYQAASGWSEYAANIQAIPT